MRTLGGMDAVQMSFEDTVIEVPDSVPVAEVRQRAVWYRELAEFYERVYEARVAGRGVAA